MKKPEQQLSLIPEPKKRGGYRAGSGRKAIRGETKVMRVPVRFESAVTQLIEHLEQQSKSDCFEHETEISIRDLLERRVSVTFKTILSKLKS